MLSFFSPKAPSLPKTVAAPGSTDPCTLLRLIRENQQLRRELEDAHYRIRELESSSKVCLLPTSDDDDDDGSISIEVQSMDNGISVTSSATTIPTGSTLANHYRARQQKRDLRQQANAIKTKRRCRKLRTNDSQAKAHYLLNKYRDPYSEYLRNSSQMSLLPDVREDDGRDDDYSLPFLMSSSISSCSGLSRQSADGDMSERSGEVSSDVSRILSDKTIRNNPVATSAMGYLARIASADSEFSFKTKNDEDYIEI